MTPEFKSLKSAPSLRAKIFYPCTALPSGGSGHGQTPCPCATAHICEGLASPAEALFSPGYAFSFPMVFSYSCNAKTLRK